jgi:MFS family permease
MSLGAPQQHAATHRKPFALICAAGFFAIFSSTMAKNPVLPLFARHLGATPAYIGAIAAASTIVGVGVSLPAGAFSDLWGRRRVILVASLVFASAPFLYLLIANPWQLAAVRVYHGLATAIFGPVALALIADLFRHRRGETMGWYSSATLAGRALAPVVGGYLLYRLSYHAVYLGCGIAGLLALASAHRLPASPPPGAPRRLDAAREMAQAIRSVIRDRGILVTSFAEAVQYVAFGAVETFLPLYALRVGLNPFQIGSIFGAQILATTLTKPLMGRASDRYGRRPLIFAGLVVGAGAVLCVPVAGSYVALLPIGVGFGLALAIVTASTAALVSELAQARAYGSALGAMSTIMDIGHASGPIIAGVLIARWGYGVGFHAVGGLMTIAALLVPALVRAPADAAADSSRTDWRPNRRSQ